MSLMGKLRHRGRLWQGRKQNPGRLDPDSPHGAMALGKQPSGSDQPQGPHSGDMMTPRPRHLLCPSLGIVNASPGAEVVKQLCLLGRVPLPSAPSAP